MLLLALLTGVVDGGVLAADVVELPGAAVVGALLALLAVVLEAVGGQK